MFEAMSYHVIGYCAALLTTISFVPQAIMTIRTRDTRSLSLGMYFLMTTGVLLWLIYGFYQQDYALMLGNVITLGLTAVILCLKIYNKFIAKTERVVITRNDLS